MVSFNCPTYPYEKITTGANTLKGAETIPHKLLRYLMDLPDANGYEPVDDNERARVRLAKYLWYDGANPLSNPLPTVEQKLSMLFDPTHPDINTDELKKKHPKGYRLLPQKIIGQSQTDAQTILKCYINKLYEPTKYITTIGVMFEIISNVNLATNTKTNAYERCFNIEQCLHEAIDGVNFAGIGTASFSRGDHFDNGSGVIYDETTNVGRYVQFSLAWAESR